MMAITALPEATVHLLGSAQVLTTPTALIKELVDNSLDAKATSIDILISSNTLDKLEVRDNGHGIQREDLSALGRRGHTSKLRTFEELKFLGGVTLGFRGEALASAVQLGDVSITTRTDGESVANKVKLKAPGRIEGQSHTSHPVGTTVSVLNFMAKLPVRKRTFEKEAAKTLVKINQLLRAYALARPSIKFSLKVVQNGKSSWSYVPRPGGDIKAAVSQVIGRDAAMQCVEKSLIFLEVQRGNDSAGQGHDSQEHEILDLVPGKELPRISSHGEQLTIEAFLPMAHADLSKVGSGQYLSIDARPVSHEKGTMKKITTLYKKYIRGSFDETSGKVKNPFIRLNINCPIASYDANVEPAKDDVLFGNESFVLESVETLLKDLYGQCKTDSAVPVRHLTKKLDSFELLLSRETSSGSTIKDGGESQMIIQLPPPGRLHVPVSTPATGMRKGGASAVEEDTDLDELTSHKKRKWNFDVSPDYAEEAEGLKRRSHPNKIRKQASTKPTDVEMGCSVQNDLNPWIIAKITAPITRNIESPSEGSTTKAIELTTPGNKARSSLNHNRDLTHTPRPRPSFHQDDDVDLEPSVATFARPKASPHPDFESALTMLHRSEVGVNPSTEIFLVDAVRTDHSVRTIGPARNESKLLPMTPPPTLVSKDVKQLRGSNRPFISPLTIIENRAARHNILQTRLPGAYLPSGMRNETVESFSNNANLAWAMEFEERKEAATRRRREELRSVRPPNKESFPAEGGRSSPHKNRYHAAIADLEVGQPSLKTTASGQQKEPFKSSLPGDDPRAYLMRRQNSMGVEPVRSGNPPKMMRAKSTKLPMERIPRDAELYHLLQDLPVDLSRLKKTSSNLTTNSTYTNRGTQSEGLNINLKDIPGISQRLQEMVKTWVGSGEGKGYDVEFTFGSLISTNVLGVA